MNILVIGQGGREHALIRAFQLSQSVNKIYSLEGREGFGVESIKPSLQTSSAEKLIPVIKEKQIDLVVIGPEKELTEGWADILRSHDILVFGPSRQAAQLEGSKIFSKEFMKKASIPTSSYVVVKSVLQTLESSKKFSAPYVLKADGLAGGKGVFICPDQQTLEESAKKLFEEKIFGASGEKALLEKFQKGYEISVFILTNGETYQTLPLAQDYKKLKEKDQGPNTGGMGAFAPVSIDTNLINQIHETILKPTVQHLHKQNLFYRGVLYIGLIVTENGPKVLEYNVRFGDPECQVLLPLLNMDIGSLFYKTAQGKLLNLKFNDKHSCCVVLVEKGYPNHPQKGAVISLDKNIFPNFSDDPKNSSSSQSYFLHAGTKKSQKNWLVDGGRVLNAIGLSHSREEAKKQAYQLIRSASNHDLHYRKDIG